MKILITGGLGFIGAHLAVKLGENNSIDILDGFIERVYGLNTYIGSRGLEEINDIELKHRTLNLKYD